MPSAASNRKIANSRPTDAEYTRIHKMICDLKDDRSHLECQIVQLLSQQQAIDEQIESYRAHAPPILRLPTELLQIIFLWCLPSRNSDRKITEAPLLLAHVCSTWRTLSLATPELWASLHIHAAFLQRPRRAELSSYKKALGIWLWRSGTRPLSISLIEEQSNFLVMVPYMLHDLREFSPRWKHLSLQLSEDGFLHLPDLTAAQVPLLESIVIHASGSRPIIRGVAKPFLTTPSLRTVSLHNIDPTEIYHLPLTWGSLTSLSITSQLSKPLGMSTAQALRLIRMCPALTTCFLDLFISGLPPPPLLWGDNTSRETVELPKLETFGLRLNLSEYSFFGVRDTAQTQINSFFGALDLPRLRDLRIAASANTQPPCFLSLVDLLGRVPKALNNLLINLESGMEMKDIVDDLRCLGTLKSLSIHVPYFPNDDDQDSDDDSDEVEHYWNRPIVPRNAGTTPSNAFLALLDTSPPTAQNSAPILLCPLLEHISINFPKSSPVSDRSIQIFLHARRNLRRAFFRFDREVDEDIIIPDGVEVDLSYKEIGKNGNYERFVETYKKRPEFSARGRGL
ncbi:hypothetical protein H0H81_002438 [Sphagnurus paluster]|uniref:F-box domain-containing protein n=1 Tax=Sphagnurus paluster TaxID=117069 RepID=A0A9P7GJK4_9AGAR|nr:hypothetical protein H0H81_002438 [Sphagnurus paluster]